MLPRQIAGESSGAPARTALGGGGKGGSWRKLCPNTTVRRVICREGGGWCAGFPKEIPYLSTLEPETVLCFVN